MVAPVIIGAGVVSSIITLLVRVLVGTLIARIIFAFGITFATHAALESVGNFVENHFTSLMSSAGSGEVLAIANALGFSAAAHVIFSAYVASITVRQAVGYGKRIVFGGS